MRTIPEISDERLSELLGRFTALTKKDDQYFAIAPVDPRRVAFTWDPKPVGDAIRRIEYKGWIRTYHNWGYYGFFKPSLAEVLAQISPYWLEDVEGSPRANAFWLDPESASGPQLLWNADEHNPSGYHCAAVALLRIYPEEK